jgi:hypothetical protein
MNRVREEIINSFSIVFLSWPFRPWQNSGGLSRDYIAKARYPLSRALLAQAVEAEVATLRSAERSLSVRDCLFAPGIAELRSGG